MRLTSICIFAANTIHKEIQVSGNDKFYRTAFYNADGSVYGTAKLVSCLNNQKEKVTDGASGDAPGIQYLNTDSDPAETFLEQIMGSKKDDANVTDLEFNKTDLANDFGLESKVIVQKNRLITPFGGGAEFGSASEGVGAQMNAVVYTIRSEGEGPSTTKSTIFSEYWKFSNVAAGL